MKKQAIFSKMGSGMTFIRVKSVTCIACEERYDFEICTLYVIDEKLRYICNMCEERLFEARKVFDYKSEKEILEYVRKDIRREKKDGLFKKITRIHRCFNCNKLISYSQAFDHSDMEKSEFTEVWNNPNVRFLCCICFGKKRILNKIYREGAKCSKK